MVATSEELAKPRIGTMPLERVLGIDGMASSRFDRRCDGADPAPPPDAAAFAGEGVGFAIESGQRLSRSTLWAAQRRYFDQAGVSAWSTTAVPHYVTCNSALAHAYARVFLGFLRDCWASLDPSEPLTVVELGAGSGRFAYLFLTALTDLLRRSPFAGAKIRYVMTDFTETNLRFWRDHASLRPFVEQGVLDFARFDAEEDREIRLLSAGVTLALGSLRNPLGVIANYVFDGIRQDAFSFAGGRLHERLVSISAPAPMADYTDPDLLGNLAIYFVDRPAPLDYYGEPALDAILRGYAASLDEGAILFPCAAIRCIARLAALSGGRMLLLSGDRGHSRADARAEPERLGLAVHGSISMDVNYHAIAEYVAGRGGRSLQHPHPHVYLCVAAFLLGEHPSEYVETRLAYEEAIERAGPDDFYALRKEIKANLGTIGLSHALSLIRTSRWDPQTLADLLSVLWTQQATASQIEAQEVVRAVTRTWEHYYPIGEDQDLAFDLALLLHAYGGHREALVLFGASERLHGENARARWNMGICHYALGDMESALACFRDAARLDPMFVPAGAMQLRGGGPA